MDIVTVSKIINARKSKKCTTLRVFTCESLNLRKIVYNFLNLRNYLYQAELYLVLDQSEFQIPGLLIVRYPQISGSAPKICQYFTIRQQGWSSTMPRRRPKYDDKSGTLGPILVTWNRSKKRIILCRCQFLYS